MRLERGRIRAREWYVHNREQKKEKARQYYAQMSVAQKVRRIAQVTVARRRRDAARIKEELDGIQG